VVICRSHDVFERAGYGTATCLSPVGSLGSTIDMRWFEFVSCIGVHVESVPERSIQSCKVVMHFPSPELKGKKETLARQACFVCF
jgi:hypothetical protein